jgi:HEAT repeat protein
MDKQQLDKLVGIIKDGSKDFMDRNAAVEILARINDPSALSALKAIYKASNDPFLKASIAGVVGPRVEYSPEPKKSWKFWK